MMTPEEKAQMEEINRKVDLLLEHVKNAWALLEELAPRRTGVMAKMMKGRRS
jgi:hypothetical protein